MNIAKEEQQMKFTGELKEKVGNVENKDQAKEIIEETGIQLDDDELDQVAGGGEAIESIFDKP